MTTLTLEHVLENPWLVLAHDLPEHPSKLLLLTGQIAATCLRWIANERLEEFQEKGDPLVWQTEEYGFAIDDWYLAHNKIGELIHQLERLYDVPCHDFWFVRSPPKKMTLLSRVRKCLRLRFG